MLKVIFLKGYFSVGFTAQNERNDLFRFKKMLKRFWVAKNEEKLKIFLPR